MGDSLIAKLIKAEGEMPQPVFDCTNPHFKSRYASLGEVQRCIMPALQKHGIKATCSIEGQCLRLWATDGTESLDLCTVDLMPGNGMQGYGSAITYARRYALSAAFNRVADEDDDGNAAMGGKSPQKPPQKPTGARHEWDGIRDLIARAKRCGLTDDELNAWVAQTFPGVDKRDFGEAERQTMTMYLKTYISGKGEQDGLFE